MSESGTVLDTGYITQEQNAHFTHCAPSFKHQLNIYCTPVNGKDCSWHRQKYLVGEFGNDGGP